MRKNGSEGRSAYARKINGRFLENAPKQRYEHAK
jgi:hypothetical protein